MLDNSQETGFIDKALKQKMDRRGLLKRLAQGAGIVAAATVGGIVGGNIGGGTGEQISHTPLSTATAPKESAALVESPLSVPAETPVATAAATEFVKKELPAGVDKVWGVNLGERKGELTSSEAEAIALRMQDLIDKLPPYQFPDTGTPGILDREDLINLIKHIRPAIEANGFDDPWPDGAPPPKVLDGVKFHDYWGGDKHFVQHGESNCGTALKINANYVNPVTGQKWNNQEGVGHPQVINVAAHELGHDVQGIEVCKDRSQEQGAETTAQIIAAETEAFLVNKGNLWALHPLLLHLRDMAIATVAYHEIDNIEETHMEGYRRFTKRMLRDDFYGVMQTEKKIEDMMNQYGNKGARGEALRNLKMYNVDPLQILVGATWDEAPREEMVVKDLTIPGIYAEEFTGEGIKETKTPRTVVFNDLQFLLRNIDELTHYVEEKGYQEIK